MFAVEVTFLTGRYYARSISDRKKVEWPPHPARLFYALKGARNTLPPPEIYVEKNSGSTFDGQTVYVPVSAYGNNKPKKPTEKKKLEKWLRESTKNAHVSAVRIHQELELSPAQQADKVYFVWPHDNPPPEFQEQLSEVTYLGNSASFVLCRLLEGQHIPPLEGYIRWFPTNHPNPKKVLRWIPKGLSLADGDEAAEEGYHTQGYHPDGYMLPYENVGYTDFERASHPTPHWETFRIEPELHYTQGLRLVEALRSAILSHCGRISEEHQIISGHNRDLPRAAYVPLVHSGLGKIYGVAILIPPGEGATVLYENLAKVDAVYSQDFRVTLTPKRYEVGQYVTPCRVWESQIPIALSRNPGNLNTPKGRENAAKQIQAETGADSVEVLETYLPEYPPYPEKQGPGRYRKVLVHARITFNEEKPGPIFAGPGKFRGFGLFRGVKQ